MNEDNFVTQNGKNLLLYPKTIKKAYCRWLRMNVEDLADTQFFVCPNIWYGESCSKTYSNFRTSNCSFGRRMEKRISFEGVQTNGHSENEADKVFLSCRTSFIITDDLKVEMNSLGLVLSVLSDLGYAGFDKLREMHLDVGFDEVINLIACLFTSEAPLTDAFLTKQCMTRKRRMLTPPVQECRVAAEDGVLTLKVFVRKLDNAILYAECREDFVDFLFTFLAIPLEFAGELSVDNENLGCVGNLCSSLKGLIFEEQKEVKLSKCIHPHYYNCRTQLLNVVTQETSEYECLVSEHGVMKISRKIERLLSIGDKIVKVISMDSKSKATSDSASIGLVKGESKFIVSDDLVVTPMNSSSTVSLLRNLHLGFSDIEEKVISIGKAEATSLLRASLTTTSALTNGLSNLLSKMDAIEASQSTFLPKKTRKLTVFGF